MTLRNPLDCKEVKSVNLKWNQPEYSLERLLVKLQYFGHMIPRANSLVRTLMLEKIEGKWRKGAAEYEISSLTQWACIWVNSGDSYMTLDILACRPWGHKQSTWLNNWTTTCAIVLQRKKSGICRILNLKQISEKEQ